MASYNKITLVGNAGNDPQLKIVGDNRKVTEISIAVNEPARGNQPEKTEWYRVSLWDRKAEVAASYVKKGNPVLVEGRLSVRTYVDKDGKDRYSLEVLASDLVLLGSKEQNTEGNSNNTPSTASERQNTAPKEAPVAKPPASIAKTEDEDDLPF